MYSKHDGKDVSVEMLEAMEADKFAAAMDDVLLNMTDLSPEICPPDRRYMLADREAWVYEHGNICELVFVSNE